MTGDGILTVAGHIADDGRDVVLEDGVLWDANEWDGDNGLLSDRYDDYALTIPPAGWREAAAAA